MNAEEFVEKITELKPTVDELNKINYLEELIEMRIRQFEIKKLSVSEYDKPIGKIRFYN